jgi:hypothetical protein
MRQVVFTMHFRGKISRSGGNGGSLRSTSSGTSCTMQTVVGSTGAETTLQPADGDMAFIEAEIRLNGQDAFEGSGVLAFGEEGEHALRFSTSKSGQLGPSGVPGVLAGAVSWRVDGGDGRFASASGYITSTFTLTDAGELNEYQCGLVFIPD